jgi:hypothetical protein
LIAAFLAARSTGAGRVGRHPGHRHSNATFAATGYAQFGYRYTLDYMPFSCC